MSELERDISKNIIADQGIVEFTKDELDGLSESQLYVLELTIKLRNTSSEQDMETNMWLSPKMQAIQKHVA